MGRRSNEVSNNFCVGEVFVSDVIINVCYLERYIINFYLG